jgi:hypothetical protein
MAPCGSTGTAGLSDHYPLSEDPGVTRKVVYEGGKVRLRHYAAQARRTYRWSSYTRWIKAFILDIYPGRSVMANLTRQGFEVSWLNGFRRAPIAGADSTRM